MNGTTTYRFAYGPTIAYGQTTPEQEITSPSAELVSAPLSDLAPGTTYHYRLIAEGTDSATGEDETFTTRGSPPSPPALADLVLTSEGPRRGRAHGRGDLHHHQCRARRGYGRTPVGDRPARPAGQGRAWAIGAVLAPNGKIAGRRADREVGSILAGLVGGRARTSPIV